MADNSIDRILQNFFSKSGKSDWKKIAVQETQGKDPFEILSWRGKDGILSLPYYDALDVAHLQYLDEFQISAEKNDNLHNRTWVNVSAIDFIDEATSNQLALRQLSLGAEGIMFDLRSHHPIDLDALMKEIVWPYCFVCFKAEAQNPISETLQAFIQKHFDPSVLRGALFWESIPKNNNFKFYFNACENFKALGVLVAHDTPATEISDALLKGVKTFQTFRDQGAADDVFHSISFSLPTNASFLESAAKFKVLRMLWFQVAHAYGQNNYKAGDLHIHARSEKVADASYGPHENMLKGTFAAIAAIAGGCDSLTIECDDQLPMIPRWAKNVSAILKEESFFNEVADPLAGAYAYDALVDSLAQKAWELFQLKSQHP